MTENPPAEATESDADATGWLGWCSWPPRGGETPMPGAEFDDLIAADAPDPATALVGLMGRPRRFKRAREDQR